MSDQRFSYEQLTRFVQSVFEKIGCPVPDAQLATQALLSADLRGIDSHGVARLSGYVRLWEVGRVNARPNIRIIHETPSTAVVDGDGGLGLIVATRAMSIAIEKAKQVGTGWVSVQNSNHFGIAAFHAMQAMEQDMIGWAMTNASPLVAPTFSKDRLLGTNPICVAAPAGEEPSFVADLATTTAANGKLEILQRKKQNTPTGWVQDAEGNSAHDVGPAPDAPSMGWSDVAGSSESDWERVDRDVGKPVVRPAPRPTVEPAAGQTRGTHLDPFGALRRCGGSGLARFPHVSRPEGRACRTSSPPGSPRRR